MKTILVATDFSETALNATRYAADMAMAMDANLFLLNAYQIPISYTELPLVVDADVLIRGAEEEMLKLKNEIIHRSDGKLQVTTGVNEGLFFQELNKTCKEIKPFFVIIGTQGITMTARLFFGMEAVYTMKHLEWPVIAVPPNASYKPIVKIGLACDLKQVEDIPLGEIKNLINDFNAELHVLNTSDKKSNALDLEAQTSILYGRLGDLKPHYHFIQRENIDEGTLEFADKNQIDLLVVLPRRHNLISQLMFKSHTKEFVLHTHVPVIALHH